MASLEEIFWRQKSRALFVKEGDNNTRCFYRLANSRRNANLIKRIEMDGILYEDEADVRFQLVLFYQVLYKETEAWRLTMDGLDFACIEEEERLSLEEFSKEEVIQVLREMEGDQAPGPDGFTMASPWLFFTDVGVLWKRMSWISLITFIGTLCLNGL